MNRPTSINAGDTGIMNSIDCKQVAHQLRVCAETDRKQWPKWPI